MKKKGPSYWNGKRNVGGTAAQLHIINTINGGWESHHEKFAKRVRDLIQEMNEEATKPQLKVINPIEE